MAHDTNNASSLSSGAAGNFDTATPAELDEPQPTRYIINNAGRASDKLSVDEANCLYSHLGKPLYVTL